MTQGNILLVWEPGAGKTYPVLSACHFVDGPILIVVPASLRGQWLEAARRHAPMRPAVILDRTKEKIPADTLRDFDIFICSYEYVATLPQWKQLRVIRWGALAIDEVHYLMNLEADRTRAMFGLKAEERQGMVFAADFVWALSGTPFQFPNQIYPLLSRVFPEAIRRPSRNGPGLMTAREWENEFCVVADKGDGFGVKIVDAQNVDELRRRLAPVLDKVKLSDAFDMPPLTVDTITIEGDLKKLTREMSPELAFQYQALMDVLHDDDIPDTEKLAAVEESGLVMAQLRNTIAAIKVSSVIDLIRNELFTGADKLLIFGWHREPLKAMAQAFKAPIMFGGMGDKRKEAVKKEWIRDDKSRVLFGQIGTMGTGTDGLQEVCHRSMFAEISWAFRENKQCIHRTYRGGQRLPCHASIVTLKGSIDEYVAKITKRNAEIISRVLD